MSQRPRNPIIQMLCIDQETNAWSNTKLWANIGYGIMCWTFIYQVLAGSASTELWAVFGTLIIGNRTLNKYISRKKEDTNVSS